MRTFSDIKDEIYKCIELLVDCETSLLQHHVEIIEHVLLWVAGDSSDDDILGCFITGKEHPVIKAANVSPADLLAEQKDAYLQLSRGNNEIQFRRSRQRFQTIT